MGILDKYTYKKIEYYFYNYFPLKRELEEKREEILSYQGISGISKDILKFDSSIHSKKSDITAAKTMKLCEIQDKEKWLRVIEAVLEHYKDTLKFKLIEKKYFEGFGEGHICKFLHIERATYYNWRDEIILYAALLLARENLI